MTRSEIGSLRLEIERIDTQIIELMARRAEVAGELGLIKRKDGLPIRDITRERIIIQRYERLAKKLGLDRALSTALADMLIADAVRIQKLKSPKSLDGIRALVVGGSGRMGAWMCRFLSNRGASVAIWDPRGSLEGYPGHRTLEKGAKTADMIIVASPLGASKEDLKEVLELKPDGLIFDLCSIKADISADLRKAARDGLKVTSVHPMFGPRAPSPKGRVVLVCECGSRDADREAASLFRVSGAHVTTLKLEKHDQLMAYALGLPHLTLLLFGSVALSSGRTNAEMDRVAGPSFERLSRLVSELSNESRRVYHDIQALNPNTKDMLSEMEARLVDLRKAALESDPKRFRKIMDKCKDYFEVDLDG